MEPTDTRAADAGGVHRRRTFLAGGLLGAAGVGGLTGFSLADRSPRPVASAGRLDYGPGPSGGDDHGRLQDAVEALAGRGGALYLRSGSYRLGRALVVPPGIHLVGEGGFPISERSGTSIVCTSDDAGLWFRGGSNGARDVTVFGNGQGRTGRVDDSAAIKVGGTGSGDVGADCYFSNVSVGGAAGTGWLVQGTQNSTFTNCRVQQALGDGLVLDYSAGGLLLERFESAENAGHNLRITQTRRAAPGSYGAPSHNTFLACIFEQRRDAGSCVLIDLGDLTSFLHCAFANWPGHHAGDTSPLVQIDSGRVDVHSPVVYLEGTGRVAFGVTGSARGTSPRLVTSGLGTISGGAGAFAHVDAAGALFVNGPVLGLHDDTPTVGTTLTSSDTAQASVLGLDTTPGAGVQTVTPSNGALQLDVSSADQYVVQVTGQGLTALRLTGGHAGRSITLIFVQGTAVAPLALPARSDGFLWSGGDASRPTLTSANGYLAVQLLRVDGNWIELSRAGTDRTR